MAVTPDAYDFTLTIDSNDYGFLVAEQDGVKMLNEGIAPFLTQQINTGAYSYSSTPPEIEVPMAVEEWDGGAGYDIVDSGGTVSLNTYEYSRGIDLSHIHRAYVSPEQQPAYTSTGSAIAASANKFVETSLGTFMLAGAYIYKFDATTTSDNKWILVDDSSATFGGAHFKDLAELDGVLYASRGSSADYRYSSNGTTWTAYTTADENADYFVTRGNGSDIASIWKVLANLIKGTVDGQTGATAWSGADEVGHTSETTTGMICVNNDIYVFKQEGIYVYDGTNTIDLWKTKYRSTNNGRNPFLWVDGNIYAPYGRRLLQLNPLAEAPTLTPVFPLTHANSVEVRGDITAIGGDDYHLYLAVKNREGNTYIVKGKPNGGWHTFLYLGDHDCNAIAVISPGNGLVSNPILLIGYGISTTTVDVTNLITNPSLETGSTGYSATGATGSIALSTGASKFGSFSLLVGSGVTSGGSSYTLSSMAAGTYTISCFVKMIASFPLSSAGPTLATATSGSVVGGSSIGDRTNTTTWQRLSYAVVLSGTADIIITLTANGNPTGPLWFMDGLMVETGNTLHDYVDGSLGAEYSWSGTAHASTSTYSAIDQAPYYILTRENVEPDQDPNYRYSSEEGTVYGSYFNFGAKTYSKFLNHGSVLCTNASGGRPVVLSYETDYSGTVTTLVSVTSPGLTDEDVDTEVSFNQIRYVMTMQTGDDTTSPIVDSLSLFATLNPPRKRLWSPVVALSDDLPLVGGAYDTTQPSAQKLKELLFGALTKRLTYTDNQGNTFTVRLLDIQPQGVVKKQIGGKEYSAFGYGLKLVEIASTATTQRTAIYDSDTYDSGVIYA